MPKLGESIQEGTITKWFVKEGDTIEEDDILFEVATDKVDSEIPSPVDGVITKILFPENSLVPVGEVLAIINMGGEAVVQPEEQKTGSVSTDNHEAKTEKISAESKKQLSNRFYSPLVKTIAKEENITPDELETIKGSGANGRVQKKDILDYLENKSTVSEKVEQPPIRQPEKNHRCRFGWSWRSNS
jgi:2-oxoglutarate dehydrogenase E2 component (dihydrolipoamide succinyltransferase)